MDRNFLILIIQSLLLIGNLVRLFLNEEIFNESTIQWSVIFAFVGTFFFISYFENKTNLKQQFLKISYFFILGFLIVHFQIYLDFLQGNYNNFRRDYFIFPAIVGKASIISCLALNVFYLGYLLRLIVSKQNNSPLSKVGYSVDFRFALNVILLFILICFITFLFVVDKSYFSGKYGEIELEGIAHLSQVYFNFGVVAYIAAYSYYLKETNTRLSLKSFVFSQNKLFLGIIITYLLLVLFSGDRGPLIQLTFVFLGAYSYSQSVKIKSSVFVLGIILGASFITLLGQIRSFRDEEGFLEKYELAKTTAEKTESNFSFSPATHELAISVRTVHAAVDMVDEQGLKFGLVQVNQIFAIVPGLGTLLRSLSGLETRDLASADIFTHYILGDNPSHGLGTSCLADIYIDFGVIGILVAFFIFGIFVRYLEEASSRDGLISLFIWVLLIVFLSKALYLGRSSIMIVFRECIGVYFIILVATWFKR